MQSWSNPPRKIKPTPIPASDGCRELIPAPLAAGPLRIAPELITVEHVDVFVPSGPEVVHVIASPSGKEGVAEVAVRIGFQVIETQRGRRSKLLGRPIQLRPVPIRPVCTMRHVAVQRAPVAVDHDEHVWPFACQSVLEAPVEPSARAVDRARPILFGLEADAFMTTLPPSVAR